MSQQPEPSMENYFRNLRTLGLVLHKCWNGVKYKPLIGGSFQGRDYCLASLFHTDTGLYDVSYYVLDLSSKFPLSCADTKAGALSFARDLLQTNRARVWSEIAGMARDIDAYERRQEEARQAWLAQERARAPEKVKSIPRRRQQIFNESNGTCHYCGTALTLDGKWHIEHKMPKALGGGNEPGNLVASCVSCNHRKHDTTDVEFKAKLAKETRA